METTKKSSPQEKPVTTESTISCPNCGCRKTEKMPEDACEYFYECSECKCMLKPKEGDCCVYCSYGDTPCPPVQRDGKGCCCCC